MSVLEEATEALRKRQAAADAALQIDQDYHASGTAGRAIAAVDYVKATAELADQWLRLAAIEAGHNPFPAPVRYASGTLPTPNRAGANSTAARADRA